MSLRKRMAVRCSHVAELNRECLSGVVGFLAAQDKARLMATSLRMCRAAGAAVHWQQLVLGGSAAEDAKAVEVCVRRTNGKHPLKELAVEGSASAEQSIPHEEDDDGVSHNCVRCAALIEALPGHLFYHLKRLELRRLPWLTACVAEHILSNAPRLQFLEIEQNINVNRIVKQVAASCHALEVLSFKHVEVSGSIFDNPATPQRCLETSAVNDLTAACPSLRRVCFNHYVIEEDSVEGLLKAPTLEEVDLSDNEGLHGFFLANVPRAWPHLRALNLRDCTEMQETAVVELVQKLVNGACDQLVHIDVSCQWAHVGESFLSDAALREELVRQRPKLHWREDHCQIPGFGIDPDEEIWLQGDDFLVDGEESADFDDAADDGETVIDEDIGSFEAAVRVEDDDFIDSCELLKSDLLCEDKDSANDC